MTQQRTLTLAACGRILRPIVRLALAMGVKHAELQGLLVDLLLDEAGRSWHARGIRPNISQLSVTTGLNRKAVTARVRAPSDVLPATESSPAARTLTLWLQMVADDPALRRLPVTVEGKTPSFESMAWLASRGNLHHRAILDELVRLGMATEHDGQAELRAEGFVPANDLRGMLAYLADNGRDHLQSAVANVLREGSPMLERAVYADGLSLEDCEAIHQLVRRRWGHLHHELAHEMRQAVDRGGDAATGRIRVGIYTYFEDASPDTAGVAVPEPTSAPT
ncbi:DUF6502 family protein [Variovorax sp. ZT4R33]|uniref:DUF6502 family protein n=1 Tax=Variovorax sp. ZT4R33 TaxID=3443743 RepID=UPI003F475BFD